MAFVSHARLSQSMPSDAFEKEIERFAENKRRLLMSAAADEETWRQAIRRQLELELETQVQQALAPPPQLNTIQDGPRLQKLRVSQQTRLCREVVGEKLDGEQENIDHQSWSMITRQRHVQNILTESSYQLAKSYFDRRVSRFLLYNPSGRHNLPDAVDEFASSSDNCRTRGYYEQLSLKADRVSDLSLLTSSERHALNYVYTRQGYREAFFSGTLPDGSQLERVNDEGWYRDKLGLLRSDHGPFWPIDIGPLCPAPQLKKKCVKQIEPLLNDTCTLELQAASAAQCPPDPSPAAATVDSNESQSSSTIVWRGTVVVFDSERTPRDYKPRFINSRPNNSCLTFESRFESGNLRQARRVGEFEYELVLQTDVYTKRHTQWFFFRVSNARPNCRYTFKIINFLKPDSLYNYGMQPLLYSTHDSCWRRVGHNISYHRNYSNMQCPLLARDRNYYVLQWQMEFPDVDDTGDTVYYLAHCYPYTYTDLCLDLDNLLADKQRSKVMHRETMCLTRAGNSCFLLTITDFDISDSEKNGIVLSARVHPGETNSSWIMKGIIEYLSGPDEKAKALRRKFVFKLVPMLNPDGVIVGNYRCSLSGRDLNRNYRHPNKNSFPTVWHIKEMTKQFAESTQVLLYCDLHGHSRRQNLFMYGCYDNSTFNADTFLSARVLPWLMSQRTPDTFSFDFCKYQIRRNKESTGRVVMFRQLKILNSFTMEATFAGSTLSKDSKRHFNIKDLEQIGQTFCEAMLDLYKVHFDNSYRKHVLLQLSQHLTMQFLQSHETVATKMQCDSVEQRDFNKDNSSESQDKCLEMMDAMRKELVESDSSDSDSESDPEVVATVKQRHRSRRKKRNKSKRGNDNGETTTSRSKASSADPNKSNEPSSTQQCLPAISMSESNHHNSDQKQTDNNELRKLSSVKSFPAFVNKYEGRSNGGIPCFSEERLQERAARKFAKHQAQRQNAFENSTFIEVEPTVSDGAGPPDLNFLSISSVRHRLSPLQASPVSGAHHYDHFLEESRDVINRSHFRFGESIAAQDVHLHRTDNNELNATCLTMNGRSYNSRSAMKYQ